MEQLLDLRRLTSDTFITVYDPWLPPGAQAIYGGTMVAQCIIAAQATFRIDCTIASLRSTFVQGGKPNTPIHYKVHEYESDASIPLRGVRASQDGQCIFTAVVRFRLSPRQGCSRPSSNFQATGSQTIGPIKGGGGAVESPYICSDLQLISKTTNSVQGTTIAQWLKACRPIMVDNPAIHLAALAYMSDNYLLPTATRVHGIRWSRDPEVVPAALAGKQVQALEHGVKLMVSLDHTIIFDQASEAVRADAWIRSEMHSPWAGQERALVSQRMYSTTGNLLATVYQEVSSLTPRHVCHRLTALPGCAADESDRAFDALNVEWT
ncbi:hypothetical protein DOTSEDRAFT_171582 [Dothistroma septosporum NZE10]|uniref:Acyl-CoA thioesterase II n=1 Tax=Dothistroma septosporum (strain NZE10 / CBS 128990) TaxID=675120 RepID=N1PMU2_DOTSN|nr:hypothetical protein DOTSEDRAFT_171582 [Dothistroma septosporum NZE10]